MDGNEILLLGLGIQAPWKLVDQRLDVDKQPHEPHLTVSSDCAQKYACPGCGEECSAHDFQEKTWRHLNFFQLFMVKPNRTPRGPVTLNPERDSVVEAAILEDDKRIANA